MTSAGWSRFLSRTRTRLPEAAASLLRGFEAQPPHDAGALAEAAQALVGTLGARTAREAGRRVGRSVFDDAELYRVAAGKDVAALYLHAAGALLPSLLPGVRVEPRCGPHGGIEVWLELPGATAHDDGVADVFEVLAGVAEELPRLRNERPGEVHVTSWPARGIGVLRTAGAGGVGSQAFAPAVLAAVDQSTDGIVELAADGRILFVNARGARDIGYTRDDLVGRNFDEFVSADERAEVVDHFSRALGSREPTEFDLSLPDASGEILTLSASVTPFVRPDGSPGAVATLRRIDMLRERAGSLASELAQLRRIFEGRDEIVCVSAADDTTPYVHCSLEGFSTVPRDATFMAELLKRVDPEQRPALADAWHSARDGGRRTRHEFRARADDGTWRWLEARFDPIDLPEGGAASVARFQDASERKAYEEAMRAIAAVDLEHADLADALLRSAVEAIGVEHAFVALPAPDDPHEAVILSAWPDGKLPFPARFTIEGCPFEASFRGEPCCYAERAHVRFPEDGHIREATIESLISQPILDPQGQVLGTIVAAGRRPLRNVALARSTLSVFAQRISAQLHREHTTDALRASEARFRALVEQSPDLIVEAEPGRGTVYVSPSIREVLGQEPDLGYLRVLLETTGGQAELHETRESAGADEPVRRVIRLDDQQGRPHWFDTSTRSYTTAAGRRRVVLYGRDITRRRLEEGERAQLRALMENSSDLMGLASLAGDVIFVNRAGRRLLGGDDDDPMPHQLWDFFPAGEAKRLRESVLPEALRSGAWSGPSRLRRMSRGRAEQATDTVPVDLSLIVHSDERSQSPTALAFIARDRREHLRTELELEAAATRFEMLTLGSRDLVAEFDAAGRFLFASPNFPKIIGYDARDLIGRFGNEFFPREERDALTRELGQAMESGGTTIQNHHVVDARGEWVPVETSLVGYRTPTGEIRSIAITRDLRERNAALAALRQSEEHLRQSQKMEAIGRLAGGIAHDFNNLLTAITGHADLLIDDLPADSPSRADATEILEATRRAAALTRQLLAFSRRQVLQPTVIDLNRLVSEIDRMLRRVIGEDYPLVCELEGGLWAVMADAGQVEQVLLNLVVNARDAMPEGGQIRIATSNHRAEAAFTAVQADAPAGDYVVLSVTDVGVGMPEAVREHIFEPFFTTKSLGRGTGLGLSTVLGIVQQTGGYVRVDSQEGAGSRFDVFLPRTHEQAREPDDEPVARSAPGGATILLVEDEGSVRRLVERHLVAEGYRVLSAENAEEALRISHDYDGSIELLLSDVVLPTLDGPTVAQRLCVGRPTLRVAFLSGFTDDALERYGIEEAASRLLPKPFTRSALLQFVSESLTEPGT